MKKRFALGFVPMELGLAWSRWKCFRDIKVRAFFNLAKHTLRKRDGPIPEDWLALQFPLLPVPFSRFLCYHAALFLSPLSIDRTTANANISHRFFFSSSDEDGKNAKFVHRESWLDSNPNGRFKRIRQPMSNSSLRNRLLRFLRPPLFLFSFSPSNEQLRRNWINLDGEKFRAEEGQPAKTLFRVAFRSKGSADGFRISDPVVIDLPVKSGTVTRRYPDLVEEEGGRPGAGLLKFFIVALFLFGQEARLRKNRKQVFRENWVDRD